MKKYMSAEFLQIVQQTNGVYETHEEVLNIISRSKVNEQVNELIASSPYFPKYGITQVEYDMISRYYNNTK